MVSTFKMQLMKNLVVLFFLSILSIQVLGQDTFIIKAQPTDSGTVYGCEDLLITYSFEYNGSFTPDSAIAFINGKRSIRKTDWNIIGSRLELKRFLSYGKYGH